MTKVITVFCSLLVLTVCCGKLSAQSYPMLYKTSATDSGFLSTLQLPGSFPTRIDALNFVAALVPQLQAKGFITASVDSATFDSSGATLLLYLGEKYHWGRIRTAERDAGLLAEIRFPVLKGPLQFTALSTWQQRILDYLENDGHPFGRSYLDSIELRENGVEALLRIERGPVYKIDSIQLIGDAKIQNSFLQKYLNIFAGSRYNKSKLDAISKKIAELTYVEEERPADLTLLATGSTLNLYLKARQSSQVNALVGFLPNSEGLGGERKFLLTVDANILLRNALGAGETIGLVWQQLQQSSPRLNLLFEQPYIFKSPFGAGFSLDIYKRDSVFLNINMNLNLSYRLAGNQTASVFLQRRQSIVNGINSAAIIQSKRLPEEADVSSFNLGVGYDYSGTDYRFNPRKGNQFIITTSAGTKRIRKNNLILQLKDPSNPSFKFERLYDTVKLSAYQFRIAASGARFFPLGRITTFKLGVNAGVYQSPNIFRNELFQIGGNRLLRGFDEESQFVSQYALGTAEFRLLTGLNSAFFTFLDGGWAKHPLSLAGSHTYFSLGAGLSFQPKAGLINVTYAVGQRNDADFNLRQSKIHIGFVSFF